LRANTRAEIEAIAQETAQTVFRRNGVRKMAAQMAGAAVARQVAQRATIIDEQAREAIGKAASEAVAGHAARLPGATEVWQVAEKAVRDAVTAAEPEVLDRAREAAEKAVAGYAPPVVNVVLPDRREIKLRGDSHRVLPEVLTALHARCHVLLVGTAGTGKSMLAKQAAEALGLEFQALSVGPTTPMSKVFGYFDAHGHYHDTPFRRAFEHGGVMLLDELDNGHPGLLAELNQALALGTCAFADGMVDAHPDFRLIATGNTYGSGGDRTFVGRQALDAATLDRFIVIDVPIDPELEKRIALAHAPSHRDKAQELLEEVWRLRELAEQKNLPVMFSPRASIDGAKLLEAGASLAQVLQWRVTRGLSATHLAALGLAGS
jgi:cobaltochelatase CobS